MLYQVQRKTALPEAVVAAAAAAELGCIGEFEGEPVVDVEFAIRLVGAALGKHSRLPEAGPVECQPAGVLVVAEASWHWQ